LKTGAIAGAVAHDCARDREQCLRPGVRSSVAHARLAATLLTAMLVSFGLLANGRVLLADHSSHWNWTESAVNLALTGAAWVVADSLARPRR